MDSSIGTILRNKITNQLGRVVRLAENNSQMCYVVFITRDPGRGEILGPESLWRREEVEVVPPPRFDLRKAEFSSDWGTSA